MKVKRIIAGIVSVFMLSCVLQFSTVYATGIYVNGKNLNPDINVDKTVSEDDLGMVREGLVDKHSSNIDVNCDNKQDVKDLVSLKVFMETNYGRDNDFSGNDL